MSRIALSTPRPLARAASILLVALCHLALWQGLRPGGWPQHAHNAAAEPVRYLQLLTVRRTEPAAPSHNALATLLPPPTVRKRTGATAAAQPDVRPTNLQEPAPISLLPAEAQSDSKSLDLEALRSTALAQERRRKRSEIEQMQAGHWRDQSLEQQLGSATQKAQRKDCRNAYAGIGLLAIIPLAVSTVVDTGCKW